LNHERYAEEVAMGLHEKGRKSEKNERGDDRNGPEQESVRTEHHNLLLFE
jgi:hypothetical protein